MQCYKCRGLTISREDGMFFCQEEHCRHIELYPLNYQFEFPSNRDQDKPIQAYLPKIIEEESTDQQKVIKKCRELVKEVCYVYKYPNEVLHLALSTANLVFSSKFHKKSKLKETTDTKKIASFSLFVACYNKQFFFQEYRIARYFRFSIKSWNQIVAHLTTVLKEEKVNLPPLTEAAYFIRKMCKIRNIRSEDADQMREMCEKVKVKKQNRASTIACMIFWKFFEKVPESQVKLEDICKQHEEMFNAGQSEMTIERYFDVAPPTVRKLFQELNSKTKQYLTSLKEGKGLEQSE